MLQRLSVTAPWWSPSEAVLIEGDPFTPFGEHLSLSLPFDSFNMYSWGLAVRHVHLLGLLRHLLELCLITLLYSAFVQECKCSDMRSNALG